jgi:hypothetical protein
MKRITLAPAGATLAMAAAPRSVISMKRASVFVSLVAVAFLPACILEVQDPQGGWNGGGGSGTGGQWGGPGPGSSTGSGSSRRDASVPVDARRPYADAGADSAADRPRDTGMTGSLDTAPPPPPADAAPPTPDPGTPPGTDPICRHSDQCQGGRCVEGACQRPCDAEYACGTGQVCSEGFCQPNPEPGDECVYSSDCGPDATCVNGFCHTRCMADDGCDNPRDRCDRGLCRPDVRPIPQCTGNAQCPADRTCVDAVCRNPCRDDSQCGPGCSGTVCSNGFCFMPEELEPPPCPPMPGCGSPTGCSRTCG